MARSRLPGAEGRGVGGAGGGLGGGEEALALAVEDGRTGDVLLRFEGLNEREEDWEVFVGRLGGVERGWTCDGGEV